MRCRHCGTEKDLMEKVDGTPASVCRPCRRNQINTALAGRPRNRMPKPPAEKKRANTGGMYLVPEMKKPPTLPRVLWLERPDP